MSELNGGSEVSSSEVSEAPAAETGGEASEATQEAAIEQANESGGFEDDTETTMEDEESDEEDLDSEEEGDGSQDVGFEENDDVENSGDNTDDNGIENIEEDLPDEDKVCFDEDESDIGDDPSEEKESDENPEPANEESDKTEESDNGENSEREDETEKPIEDDPESELNDVEDEDINEEDSGDPEEYDDDSDKLDEQENDTSESEAEKDQELEEKNEEVAEQAEQEAVDNNAEEDIKSENEVAEDENRKLTEDVSDNDNESSGCEHFESKTLVSDDTRECLSSFEQENWDNLSQVEKEQAAEKLRDSIAEDLQIENKPNIAYYNNEDPGDFGGYAASTNTIYINRYNMGDSAETADTIAHESRHCWQHERAENPQTEQDYQFKENFEDYVRPEDDYRAYKNQIVEADARDYASRVVESIPDNNSVSNLDNTVNRDSSHTDNEFSRAPPDGEYTNSKTLDSTELPGDFESKEKAGDYSTKIDDKVETIEKESLPSSIVNTFKDGEYRTVVTTESVTLYRVYGGVATLGGSFSTTEPCVDKDKTQNDLALVGKWGNTIEKEAEITVPAGTKLNIGRAAEQRDGEKTLTGDADQVLLPQNWDQDWVDEVRDIE